MEGQESRLALRHRKDDDSMVSDHQLKLATKKLADRGIVMAGDIDRRDVAQMIAQIQDMPIPRDGSSYSSLIWDFIAKGDTPTAEPRKFQPLQKSRAWAEVEKRINMNYSPKHSAGRFFNRD